VDGLGVLLPHHVHLVDVVCSVAGEERVRGVDALVGVLSSDGIVAVLRGELVVGCDAQFPPLCNKSRARRTAGDAAKAPRGTLAAEDAFTACGQLRAQHSRCCRACDKLQELEKCGVWVVEDGKSWCGDGV
jgi:hypothetical protein